MFPRSGRPMSLRCSNDLRREARQRRGSVAVKGRNEQGTGPWLPFAGVPVSRSVPLWLLTSVRPLASVPCQLSTAAGVPRSPARAAAPVPETVSGAQPFIKNSLQAMCNKRQASS
jgi:hypothetical protein